MQALLDDGGPNRHQVHHQRHRLRPVVLQDATEDLSNLDLIPPQWLHITMQGIGFADEISTADLSAVAERLGKQLRAVELRLAMFDAIAAVIAPAKFSEPRPPGGIVYAAREGRLCQW